MDGTPLRATAADGVEVVATSVGRGRPVLLLPGGIDFDARSWAKAVPRLAERHQVVALLRRRYRADLGDPWRWSMADEAQDVVALAEAVGGPVTLLGHSSGAVLTLEALARYPGVACRAVVYEPPIVVDGPVGGSALDAAEAAYRAGHRGRAMALFLARVVGLPAALSWPVGALVAAMPGYRGAVGAQLADTRAIDELGNRLAQYAAIDVPLLLVSGDRSPEHLRARSRALEEALPRAERWTAAGQGHSAQSRRPAEFTARVVQFLEG